MNGVLNWAKEKIYNQSQLSPSDVLEGLPFSLTAGPVFFGMGCLHGLVAKTSILGTGILLGGTIGVWNLGQLGLHYLAAKKILPLSTAYLLSSALLLTTFTVLSVSGLALGIIKPPSVFATMPFVLLSSAVPIALAFMPELDSIAPSS